MFSRSIILAFLATVAIASPVPAESTENSVAAPPPAAALIPLALGAATLGGALTGAASKNSAKGAKNQPRPGSFPQAQSYPPQQNAPSGWPGQAQPQQQGWPSQAQPQQQGWPSQQQDWPGQGPPQQWGSGPQQGQ